jgi:hypothetical protein
MEYQQPQTPNIDKLPSNVKQQAMQAGESARAIMDRATVHHHEGAGASAGSHGSHGDSREALMHTAGAPGKSQAALSPTDNHKGQTHTQGRQQERSRGMER